jgi:hypothetical protein
MALTIGVFSRGLHAAAFKNLSETIKKEISVFFKNMKPCFSKLVNGGSRNNIDPSSGIYRSCFSVKSVTLEIIRIANNSLQILRSSPFFEIKNHIRYGIFKQILWFFITILDFLIWIGIVFGRWIRIRV